MTALPLTGRRVVVTRARAQSASLVERLERLGARVVELPVIAIEAPADGGAALAAASDRLVSGAYRWVALTSPNAAARLIDALSGRRPPGSVRWAAVGEGTAGLLLDAGITADLLPKATLADSLADAFPARGGDGSPDGTVLFPRAETVRSGLASGLRSKGWAVEEVVAYRTVAGDPSAEAVAEAAAADAVAFTSSSTVERTIDLLGRDGLPPVVVTIGPVTSSSVVAAGLAVSVEADPHTLEGLVAALVAELGAGPAPGGRAPGGQVEQLP